MTKLIIMHFYSTNDAHHHVDLSQAVLRSLAPDKGLYMPSAIAKLDPAFFTNLDQMTFAEMAEKVTQTLLKDVLPAEAIKEIISKTVTFEAPVIEVSKRIGSLELWHGPSLAFKDFGARFMAALMSYLTRGSDDKLTILVATSGDTGGAVAYGFLDVPGVEVIILYPKGKVSALQEKQLTTLGANITALEVDGSFDDCQRLVKSAFVDDELNERYNLSSANSINISRLIPQMFYYFEAYRQVRHKAQNIIMAVPSGNFGNLTAGLMAKRMGLPVDHFIAATNVNNVVPSYLKTGRFEPMTSIPTISNAMDVGNPSNFARMLDLYPSVKAMQNDISGYYYSDEETKEEMQKVYIETGYVTEPHGAIGHKALASYLADKEDCYGVFFETAHPAKFLPIVESTLDICLEIPERLAVLRDRVKIAQSQSSNFADFKSYLEERING